MTDSEGRPANLEIACSANSAPISRRLRAAKTNSPPRLVILDGEVSGTDSACE